MNTLRIVPEPQATYPSPERVPAVNEPMGPAVPLAPARPPRRGGIVAILAIALFVTFWAGAVGVVVLVGGTFAAIKSSAAYQASLAFIRNDSRAVAALGSPIEDGLMPSGTVKRTGGFGNADFVIDLSGPRASGSARVVSHRDGARWVVDAAQLVVDDRTETLTP